MIQSALTKATATEVKNRFGTYLDAAQKQPVMIEKSGRNVAVLISADDFAHFEALQDAWWGERAKAAEASGSATPDEIQALFNRLESGI
jgi:antitoxin Phd